MNRSSRTLRTVSALAALPIAVVCTTALASNIRPASAASAASTASPTAVAPVRQSAITINNYAFHPASLTVAKGTTVVWINEDDDVHTIKGKDGPEMLQSPALATGARFGFTFSRPGTYHYICTVHPYMHGIIVVR